MALASVLIVEDEEKIRTALRRELETLDYDIHLADSAAAGLAFLKQHHADIVISDQEMPGMKGLQFLQILRQTHPDVIRIMLTGHASLTVAMAAINKGEIFRFVEKPWDDQELKMILLQASRKLAPRPPA